MNDRNFSSHEEAFRHVVNHTTMLRACIRTIVHDSNLAEDVLSDTAIEITRSWQTYDKNRPFPEWARGVARRVALASLRKQAKQPALLDPTVLSAVGAEIDSFGSQAHLEQRKETLRDCLDTLSPANRRLIELRYFKDHTYQQIAAIVKRTINALYASFSRLHSALSDCVQRNSETS